MATYTYETNDAREAGLTDACATKNAEDLKNLSPKEQANFKPMSNQDYHTFVWDHATDSYAAQKARKEAQAVATNLSKLDPAVAAQKVAEIAAAVPVAQPAELATVKA